MGIHTAVVAAEVRNLAQRSAAAAKEIKILIDDSVSKVQSGTFLVSRAGTTIDEVVNSVRQVADVVNEITAASQEQTLGIDQINIAIGQMDETTQQNAALVEQAAAAAASLNEQASHLKEIVDVFKTNRNTSTIVSKTLPAPKNNTKVPPFNKESDSPMLIPRQSPARAVPLSADSAQKLEPVDAWDDC